jgi:hypothetical protein
MRTDVTVTVTLAGTTSTFTAQTGPAGDFSLVTNLPVTPGQQLTIAARGAGGTVATVPADVGPFRPVVPLPDGPPAMGAGGQTQPADTTQDGFLGAVATVAGIGLAAGLTWRRRRTT